MRLDDEVCHCFGVSLRKLVNFARRERPARASQMRRCLEAGSGCGWCRPFLERIWEDPDAVDLADLEAAEYATRRLAYRKHLAAGAAKRHF